MKKRDIPEEFNVGEIIKMLRRKIDGKNISLASSSSVDSDIQKENTGVGNIEVRGNIQIVNKLADTTFDRNITSHRRILGPFLVKARELLYRETRRTLDIPLQKQVEFNKMIAKTLSGIAENNTRLTRMSNELKKEVDLSFTSIMEKTDNIHASLEDLISQQTIELEKYREINGKMISGLEDKTRELSSEYVDLKKELNKEIKIDPSFDYLGFENKFRGPSENIEKTQARFIRFFKDCKNVLDFGCGRGEFLGLLKEKGIGATGVDSSPEMVGICKKKKLMAIESEGLSYLRSLSDGSLDGIFAGQIIEHFNQNDLIDFVMLCEKKLKKGSYLIMETMNPLCVISLMQFYLDPTHKRPIHPEFIKFLLEKNGFEEVRFDFYSPISEDKRLKRVEGETEQIKVLNQDIERIDGLLFGNQDYAIIAKGMGGKREKKE